MSFFDCFGIDTRIGMHTLLSPQKNLKNFKNSLKTAIADGKT